MEEATSKLREEMRAVESRSGAELLRVGGEPTELFLLCGDRFASGRSFKLGNLSVHFIRVPGSPVVAMVSCMVGDHHWILARDSMVLRVASRAFIIAMPGFLYGLALSAGEEEVNKLEGIFKRFCAYHDLVTSEHSKLVGGNPMDIRPDEMTAGPDLSAHAYLRIEKLATAAGVTRKMACDVEFTAKKIQRAVRTSAMVKLVSRVLLSGTLIPTKHLHLTLTPSLPPAQGTTVDGPYALPSMWAFADLLDAVEMGHWSVLPPPRSAASGRRTPEGREGCWYFSREGLGLLLDIVNAYSGINARVKKQRLDVVEEEIDGKGGRFVGTVTRECAGKAVAAGAAATPGDAAGKAVGGGLSLLGSDGMGVKGVGNQMGTCGNS